MGIARGGLTRERRNAAAKNQLDLDPGDGLGVGQFHSIVARARRPTSHKCLPIDSMPSFDRERGRVHQFVFFSPSGTPALRRPSTMR